VIPNYAFIYNQAHTWNYVSLFEPIKGPEHTGMETLCPFYPFQLHLHVVKSRVTLHTLQKIRIRGYKYIIYVSKKLIS